MRRSFAGVVIAGDRGAPDNSNDVERAIDSRKPKNVILLVGDGAGDSELTIGRYYLNGAKGAPMAYETLPFAGSNLTWSLQYGPGPNYLPSYVPDSAHGDRVVDRQEDDRRAPLAGSEHGGDRSRLEHGI